MVKHLIVFNAAAGVSDDQCLAMARRARKVLTQIEGVNGLSFGVAVTPSAQYRYLLIVEFAGEEVIDRYRDHPVHVEFANGVFRPMAPHRITTDYKMVL